MGAMGKILGTASVVTGALGAAVLGGVAAQRAVVRRYHQLVDDEGSYDGLPADRSYTVAAEDGTTLYVEEVGPADADLTVVFAHGWTLRLGSWHFQRQALQGKGFGDPSRGGAEAKLVFYDQRSHGRSGRAEAGTNTLDELSADLAAVIATAAPTGRLVLVGHSMGGMAVMSLAAQRPALFAERVRGFVLIGTSAQFGRGRGSRPAVPGADQLVRVMSAAASRYPALLERSRPAVRDAVWLITRNMGFADRTIPVTLVDYVDRMITETPVEVIAAYLPAIMSHDVRAGLPTLRSLPGAIICGAADRLTPVEQSRQLAVALPKAKLLIIPGAGHMVVMERPDLVSDTIRAVLRQAVKARPGKSA